MILLPKQHILLAPTNLIYDGQLDKSWFRNRLNLGLRPVYLASFISGNRKFVFKLKTTGKTLLLALNVIDCYKVHPIYIVKYVSTPLHISAEQIVFQ